MENQKFTIGAVQQNRLLDLGLDIQNYFRFSRAFLLI